jgi:hypothetical protein|nr:MAG TPA: hypothetical protein [Crassvirales sp.]
MECNIKIVKLKQVLPPGTFPKREHNVRFFYHRTDGCYYMYDEKGCEINLTTDGNIIAIDRELIVGSESLTDDTLVCIGLKANYVHLSRGVRNNTCGCQDTYIRAWTYIKDLQDFLQTGHIERNYYRVSLTPSPEEGGIVGCTGSHIMPDESPDGFRFQFEAGSQVKLYAKPAPGYHFMGWKEYHSNEIMSISSDWTFNIKKDMDLIGVFEKEGSPINNFYINVDAYPATAGYVVGAGTFPKGTRHSITAAPIDGYHFVYWKNSKGILVSTNLQYDIIVDSDETYTAYFELNTPSIYNVTVNATPMGKGIVSGAGSYPVGSTVIIKPFPIEGYKVGSVTSSDGNIIDNGDGTWSIVVNQDVTVTVTFVESIRYFTFSVIANANGLVRYKDIQGLWSSWAAQHEVTAPEKTIVTIEGKADSGYEFENWISPTGATLPNNANNIIVEEGLNRKTYTAYFKEAHTPPTEFNFSLRCGLGGKVRYKTANSSWSAWSINIDGLEFTAGTLVYFEAQPESGYQFDKWNVNGDEVFEISSSIEINQVTRIEGYFSKIPITNHNVTITANANGKCKYKVGSGSYSEAKVSHSVSVADGDVLEVLAVPDNGFAFSKWTINESDFTDNPYTQSIHDDLSLSCTFVEISQEEVTITVQTDGTNEARYRIGDGSWSNWFSSEQSFKVNVGSIYSVEAQVKGNYTFKEWTTGNEKTSSNPANFTAKSGVNAVHIASFEAIVMRTLTVVAGTGGKCRAKLNNSWSDYYSGSHTFTDIVDGTKVTIEALADNGYHFLKWTDSGAPSSVTREVIVDSNKTITAQFEVDVPNEFQVIYEAIPNGSATMDGAGTYTDGKTCKIKVNINAGYTLGDVLVDGIKVPLNDQNEYSFVVEKNIKVTINCNLIPKPDKFTLTVRTDTNDITQGGVGIGSAKNLATDSGEFVDGTTATIHATAAEGYSFGGWWKDGVKVSDDVNFGVTVDAIKTYIAKFTQDHYLNLDKTSLEFEAAGGTQTVNVTSNVEWTVS